MSCYHAFTDNLDSFLSVIDETGEKVYQAYYDVWGRLDKQEDNYDFLDIRRGYTGHEMLVEFKIINMNGRLYDPYLGRFFSPDNYVQLPYDGQNFNRYSYCLNNPLKYTDPSREFLHLVTGAAIGGIFNWATHGFQFNAKGLEFFATGAVVGGLWNGIDAAIDGRDFLSGETWQRITEYSLPHGDLPIHQQTNPEVGCTQETLESISDYLGNPVSVADKSQGADFAQLAKEYGFKTKTIMPRTINSEHIVGAQMTLDKPVAITYNNGGVMHTVGLNRIKIQQIPRLLSSGVRTRINIQVMDSLHKTLQRLSYWLFNNGYIRILTP